MGGVGQPAPSLFFNGHLTHEGKEGDRLAFIHHPSLASFNTRFVGTYPDRFFHDSGHSRRSRPGDSGSGRHSRIH